MFFAHFFAHCFIYLTIVGSRFVDKFGPTLFNVFAHCFIMYSAPHCFMFLHIVHYVFCTRGERSSIRLYSKNIKIIAKLNIQNFFNSRTSQNSEGLTLKVLILFGYIYIFISNLFFSLPCDKVIVFKTYLMDNLKDFIFVNVVKYLYLYLSIDSIFP